MSRLTLLALAMLSCSTVSLPAHAETEFTFFTGYRNGGEFKEVTTGLPLEIEDGQSYAVTIDVRQTANTWMQFLYSHQETRLTNADANPLSLLEVDVDYLHLGGVYEWPGEIAQPYLVGTLGVTWFNPDSSGYDDKFRASLGLGGGVRIKLTEQLDIKLEARGYSTFLDSGGAMFCGENGCRVLVASSALWQSELRVGLSLKF